MNNISIIFMKLFSKLSIMNYNKKVNKNILIIYEKHFYHFHKIIFRQLQYFKLNYKNLLNYFFKVCNHIKLSINRSKNLQERLLYFQIILKKAPEKSSFDLVGACYINRSKFHNQWIERQIWCQIFFEIKMGNF